MPVQLRAEGDFSCIRPDIVEAWQSILNAYDDKEVFTAESDFFEVVIRLAQIFHRHGVPLLVGMDSPETFIRPGFDIHREFKLFARAGLSPIEILRLATINPARFMEEEDWGRVAVWCLGDLVLLRKNPLTSVEHFSSIQTIIANNFVLERHDLDRMLESQKNKVVGITLSQQPMINIISQPKEKNNDREKRIEGHLVRKVGMREDSRLWYCFQPISSDESLLEEELTGYEFSIKRRIWIGRTGQIKRAIIESHSLVGSLSIEADMHLPALNINWPNGTHENFGTVHLSTGFNMDELFSTTWFFQARMGLGRGPHTVISPPDFENEMMRQERAILTQEADQVVVKMTKNRGILTRTYQFLPNGVISELKETSPDGSSVFIPLKESHEIK